MNWNYTRSYTIVIVIICLFDILRMVYSGNVGVIKWWNTADLNFRDISFFWLKGQRLRYTMQFFLQLATQFCIQDMWLVKTVWFVKNSFGKSDEDSYSRTWQISHLLTVELRCKLQEKLHRITGPLPCSSFAVVRAITGPNDVTVLHIHHTGMGVCVGSITYLLHWWGVGNQIKHGPTCLHILP